RMGPYATKLRPPLPKPTVPPDAGVPVRIRRAVIRAIDTDVERRWPAMDDLLVELAFDLAARRRRVLVAGGVVLATAAVAVTYGLSRSRDHLCTGADQRLAGIWD